MPDSFEIGRDQGSPRPIGNSPEQTITFDCQTVTVGNFARPMEEGALEESWQADAAGADTIQISGASQRVRLVGFNTPEKIEPQCDIERSLGIAASERLERLVDGGDLDFASVRCACWPFTDGTDACNFGRACGTLRAGGQDVGAILIDEGLAVPFACGLTSCPPTPRPWCGETTAIAPLTDAEPQSSASCDIKGNVSVETGERIYHVSGQKILRADRDHRNQGRAVVLLRSGGARGRVAEVETVDFGRSATAPQNETALT